MFLPEVLIFQLLPPLNNYNDGSLAQRKLLLHIARSGFWLGVSSNNCRWWSSDSLGKVYSVCVCSTSYKSVDCVNSDGWVGRCSECVCVCVNSDDSVWMFAFRDV